MKGNIGEANAGNIRIANVGKLLTLLLDLREPIILLGAGASIKSGIPAAGDTVEKLARWAWCQDNGRHSEDPAIRRSDYWPWLKSQSWFRNKVSLPDLYPDAIDNLLGVKSERRHFLENLVNPDVPPSPGYRALVNILLQGRVSTVLTTNFDDCLYRAHLQENKPHRLIRIDTPDDYILFSSVPRDPQLIHLHGSVKHYTDKNLSDEVLSLDRALVEKLSPLLRDHPIIIVGYRGAEASVMNDLFINQVEATNQFAHGVYWCVLENHIDEPMTDLAENFASLVGTNFQKVPISGFDELFERDLFKQISASKAPQPVRRANSFSVGDIPNDMAPLKELSISDLQQTLLRARLTQYAERTDFWVPENRDNDWLDRTAEQFDLIRSTEDGSFPTLAGWLLFSSNPTSECPQARIEFKAQGSKAWLESCFGKDSEIAPLKEEGIFIVERVISGNLWTQLDNLTELLSLINFQFRLKAEISRNVQAYDALAIKEMIVNAIVHRDYKKNEPINVFVDQGCITVESPGGLIDTVFAQVHGTSFQEAIINRKKPIKGYRNPVISDLFYGGGQMDRQGSGLSDMALLTKNNNGSVNFSPNDDNSSFLVKMEARPEAVNELTQTALPVESETARFAINMLPIDMLPVTVWHASTNASSNRGFYQSAEGLAVPSGHVLNKRFFSFYDLQSLAEYCVSPFELGNIETLKFEEFLCLPGGETAVLKLLHDSIYQHLQARGLIVDIKNRRAYFPRNEDPEVKITYRGRLKRATRTVVKPRRKRNSDEIVYYEHKSMSFSIMRFGDEWALVITPGYIFTRDGIRKPLGRERINILSTRRSARDFNPSVMHDVSFWIAILSNESDGLFALETKKKDDVSTFAPTIVLSHRTPTISYNVSAFDDGTQFEHEIDKDLEALEKELEELASEPEEDNSEYSGDGVELPQNREQNLGD